MNEDRFKSSLEGLFSDVPPPVPEDAEDDEAWQRRLERSLGREHETPAPPPPKEEPRVEAREEAEELTPPPEGALPPGPEEVRSWRQQLLGGLLRATLVIGALAVIGSAYNAYTNGRLFLIPLWVGAYLILLLVTFWERVPYLAQAGVFLALTYGLGFLDLMESGNAGDGKIFLLALPLLTVILLGKWAGVIALLLSTLTRAAFGWAFSTGRFIPLEQQAQTSGQIGWWWSSSVVFLVLGAGLLISQNYLIPRLLNALTKSRELTGDLRKHRAKLEERTHSLRRQALQLETTVEVGRTITSILEIDRLLHSAVELIHDRFGWYLVAIFLLDESGEWAVLKATTGEGGTKVAVDELKLEVAETSMVGWTAKHRRPRVAPNVKEDEIYKPYPLLPETASEVTFPLMVGDRLLGVLDVEARETGAFDENDLKVLQSLADQVAVAIQNARRVSEEAALLEATSPIYRASHRLTTTVTPGEVSDAIIETVAETEADGCLVATFESAPAGEPENLLYLGVWRRDREPKFKPGTRLPFSESPFPFELVSTFWTAADVEQAEHLPDSARRVFEATGVRALANIPLHAQNQVIGQVVVLCDTPGPFPETSLRLYRLLSDQAAVALERARLLESAQARARREATARAIGDEVSASIDMKTTLRTAVESLSTALRASGARFELDLPQATSTTHRAQVRPSARLSPERGDGFGDTGNGQDRSSGRKA